MSVLCIAWAFHIDTESPISKLVLLRLADHANADNEAWPSIASIARDTCLSERAVRCHLRKLEEAGIIARFERRMTDAHGRCLSNLYRLNVEVQFAVGAARQEVWVAPAPQSPYPRQEVPPNQVIEPSSEPSGEEEARARDPEPRVQTTDQDEIPLMQMPARQPVRDHVQQAFESYNETALEIGLSGARALTPDRHRKLKARLREIGGLEEWRRGLAAIPSRPFLMGQNDRGWRANLDFLLRPGAMLRVLEGAYSDGKRQEIDPYLDFIEQERAKDRAKGVII